MKTTRSIQLSYEMVDDIVREELNEAAERYKSVAEGTADHYVHPYDQEEAHGMYAAIVKVLELYR
jgi:hypothetical protein